MHSGSTSCSLVLSAVSILSLQRSRSAFSLTSDDSPEKVPEEAAVGAGLQDYTSLKREVKATSLPTWKSVDRLDNSSKAIFVILPIAALCCC